MSLCNCVLSPYSQTQSTGKEFGFNAAWGNGTPLQYSCLENPMDRGAWKAAVHGVTEGRTQLRDFTFTFHFHALEKEMATHSSVLAWRIPGTGEPGGLPSMGSHRVGHYWSDLAAVAVADLQNLTCGIFCCSTGTLWLPCMQDLSSQTRDQTRVPWIAKQILNYWTTREVPKYLFFKQHIIGFGF